MDANKNHTKSFTDVTTLYRFFTLTKNVNSTTAWARKVKQHSTVLR